MSTIRERGNSLERGFLVIPYYWPSWGRILLEAFTFFVLQEKPI